MKSGIHPEYKVVTVHCACGATWDDPVDQEGAASRDLLQLPPVLHRQAAHPRRRRARRALQPQVRQEGSGRQGLTEPARADRWAPRAASEAMDGITFQKLRDIESRFAEVEAAMSDPAVAQDPPAYQKLAREAKELSPVVERYRAYKDTLQELTKVQEMARAETDPELREMAHEEARALEARRDELDAGIPLLLDPEGPERREERAPRDPRRHGRGRGRALRERDLPDVLALRGAAGLEGRRRVDQPHRPGRPQGSHRDGRGRPRLLEAALRERRPPRAARARHRGVRTHPHLGRSPWRCCPRPRRSTSRSTPRTSGSTRSARPAPAGRASTRRTRPCASPTCRRTPSSRARTRRARSRTARRR